MDFGDRLGNLLAYGLDGFIALPGVVLYLLFHSLVVGTKFSIKQYLGYLCLAFLVAWVLSPFIPSSIAARDGYISAIGIGSIRVAAIIVYMIPRVLEEKIKEILRYFMSFKEGADSKNSRP